MLFGGKKSVRCVFCFFGVGGKQQKGARREKEDGQICECVDEKKEREYKGV